MLNARGLSHHRRLRAACFSAFASASCMIGTYITYKLIFKDREGTSRLTKLLFCNWGTISFLKDMDIAFLLFFPEAINKGMLPSMESAPTPAITIPVPASLKEDSLLFPSRPPTRISPAPPPSITQAVVFWFLLFCR